MAKSKMLKVEISPTVKPVVAKYIRVSTDKQREEGFSIDIQKERLDAYSRSMFADAEYHEYVDDGYSGGSLARPRMQELINDVKTKKVTHVVVMKLDRLSRSQKDTLYLIEDVFLPNNVAFISMNESFNTATPFGRAVVGILSVFAQLERENIFERTRSGMQKRVGMGYWPGGGRVPFGYDYDQNKGILVPNKDADTVRKIYALYIEGYSLQCIADMFGLKYEKLAQQIITRKSNTGCIVYNGVEYQGRHEAIVSLETYEKAMVIMAERASKRFVSVTEHLLTGLVYCGVCGSKMRYQKWGKAGNKLVCYSQQKSKPYLVKDPNCNNEKAWAEHIEDVVICDVFAMSERMENEDEKGEVEKQTPLDILNERHTELGKKLKRLYHLYAEDGNDILLSAINDVKQEIEGIEKRRQLEIERAVLSRTMRETQTELRNVRELWPHMSLREKQNIMRSIIEKVTVKRGEVRIDYKF